jgi:hypothetical protein
MVKPQTRAKTTPQTSKAKGNVSKQGDKGDRGLKGNKGDRGLKGDRGSKGDRGPAGPAAKTKTVTPALDLVEDSGGETGEALVLNNLIIEATWEIKAAYRKAKTNFKLAQDLRTFLSGNKTRVTHALADYDKARLKRDNMMTEIKSVSDENVQLVTAAKKQQQNKGSHPSLRTLDDVQIQEVHDTAGAQRTFSIPMRSTAPMIYTDVNC